MCYAVLLSTTSSEDLSVHNTELVQFQKELPNLVDVLSLAHEYKWFVGSKTGCSCTFRHLYFASVELGFSEPVDWYKEEPVEIEATLEVISVIRRLAAQGEKVDVVDAWDHNEQTKFDGPTNVVDLSKVTNEQFRFFENHRFEFVLAT